MSTTTGEDDVKSSGDRNDDVFVEQEDGFADDDLLSPGDNTISFDNTSLPNSRSFLEREDFESELGGVDAFDETFATIAQQEIVEVIADGDRVGRPIIVIYAYRLPSSKGFDHAQLLKFLQYHLDKVVDMDYTIVYFHYGLRSHNKPPVKWLFQAYKILDRRYKKNLKALYVVHPTRFIRILWGFFKPFISAKFEDKFHYVMKIDDLEQALSVARLSLPDVIRQHDITLNAPVSGSNGTRPQTPPTPPRPTTQFGVSLGFILAHNPDSDVPPIVVELIEFLENQALDIEGIFRKSANIGSIKRLQERINKGEKIDFVNDDEYKDNKEVASMHASVLLKTFLRSLGEPVTTNALYPDLVALADVPKPGKTEAIKLIVQKLPRENYQLLKTVIKFLTKVADHSKINLMSANNLSVVFGPNLTWPTDQQVPVSQLNNLNHFCYKLIVDFEKIFEQ